ncbi:MAG: endolytic transglycosylase MltG [Anaerolineae bacterium]|nr:endolytic transglycosylase MltG [Anaerolineae bacterium]MCX8067328.1 endolytic transglycosylase MltG [Anaerolineae bacterium]MDW7992145.1 endolytic transglycosylase MltG [Anaerolineae bacterium]
MARKKKKGTHPLLRVGVFLIALVSAGAMVGVVLRAGGGAGGIGLCSLSAPPAPKDVALETYIQLHADELRQPAGTDDTPVTFVVQPGETAAQVAQRLQAMGLIRDAELFRRYLQYKGMDAGIEAGTYTLRRTMTIPEIAEALQTGHRPERVLTVREGLRLEEVAAVVAAQTGIPEEEFRDFATTGWRASDLPVKYGFLNTLPPKATLEGFLFPETYRLPEKVTPYDVVARMLATFDARVTEEMRLAGANQGLTLYQMVTLASIVEREAVIPEERPIIASVFLNRLREGWLLGADPTVQYALGYDEKTGSWWRRLYFDELGITSLADIDHPYNTYRYPGLPPGPICSPGLASIQAVAFPAQTEYFYFIADCHKRDGSHLFARTEAEHNANYASCGGAP